MSATDAIVKIMQSATGFDDTEAVPHHEFNGRHLSPICTKEHIDRLIEGFEHRKGNVWIATYLKSGTTWTQHLVKNLRGYDSLSLHEAVPWAEVSVIPIEVLNSLPTQIYKSHWWPSEHLTPNDVEKIIVVYRNPADVAVSHFFHVRGYYNYNYKGSWDSYLELFFQGNVDFDDWWQHLKEWYHQRNHPNVHFVSYEELLEDTTKEVRRIAEFLDIEVDDARVQEVVEHSSFDKMAAKVEDNTPPFPRDPNEPGFFRKGKAGDWRNHFSEEQHRRLMELTREKFKDEPELLAYVEKHCGKR